MYVISSNKNIVNKDYSATYELKINLLIKPRAKSCKSKRKLIYFAPHLP